MSLNTLQIMARYGLQALLLVPLILRFVSEAVEAVEEIGGPSTGAAKKQAVLEAVQAAYDLAAINPAAIPLGRDAFMALADTFVESALKLQKARRDVSKSWEK